MASKAKTTPSVLTIAGTDSSGGAGVLADIKTFSALECYGSCVVTALTAQNTIGVQGIHPCPPAFVQQQIQSVLGDIPIDAIKLGMLHDKAIIDVIVEELIQLGDSRPPLVVDPVMVSTSGHTLLQEDAIEMLCSRLLPLATLLTPNIQEAALLLAHMTSGEGLKIASLKDMVSAARAITDMGKVRATLIKGGHLGFTVGSILEYQQVADLSPDKVIWYNQCGPDEPEILRVSREDIADAAMVVDVLWEANAPVLFVRPKLDSRSTHGTGCTLSAALACELAKGTPVSEAVLSATNYTHQGIATARPMGRGHGPLNQLHPIRSRVIPLPTKSCPSPFVSTLIKRTSGVWKEYVQHPFVVRLGRGELPKENFLHFIKQDYHYLKHYARAYGLLAAKSTNFSTIGSAAQTIGHIIRETGMHAAYCESWGISFDELVSTPESAATTGYCTYLLETGLRGDDVTLTVALLACLLGYGEVGLWLRRQVTAGIDGFHFEGNPYKKWMEDYSGPEYQAAVRMGVETLEASMVANPPSQAKFDELLAVWERVVKLEIGFWDMAMTLSS